MRFAALFFAALGLASAHDVITTKLTWTREISRIVFARCATCHREGGKAPMSLMTYEEARPWAKAIKEEVLERRMPPWGAIKGFGEFQHDAGLTQDEIMTIAAWVEGGAPDGDKNLLPPAPTRFPQDDPAKPAGTSAIAVSGALKLSAATRVVAVRPALRPGASVQAIATRPDGVVEPLIWVNKYNPKLARTYYFKSPVTLPAGTSIEISPRSAGTLTLFAVGSTPGKSAGASAPSAGAPAAKPRATGSGN